MRTQDIRTGIAVWATHGGDRRPALVTSVTAEPRRIWVSFTDRGEPSSASVGPRSVEPRRPETVTPPGED